MEENDLSFNIAIDGPAGAGKSTIAKRLAKELDFVYVDTGAMYRALALYFIRNDIRAEEEDKITRALDQILVTIEYAQGIQKVLLNGEDVRSQIRTEAVGNMASAASVYVAVRQKLLSLQRELAATRDVIMDGRDIGTHVLPNADLKIFLTAASQTRAMRRYKELLEKGEAASLAAIEKDIIERDTRDMTRAIAPLKQAADAICVDTSELGIDMVVQTIRELYQKKVKLS